MNHTRAGGISGMALIALLVFLLPFLASAEEKSGDFTIPPVEAFILKWQKSGGSELGSSQMFITGLCDLIGVPAPNPPRPDLADNAYVFEKAVERTGPTGRKSTARIDLWIKGRLIWESKQGSDKPTPRDNNPRRIGTAVRGTPSWDRAMLDARIQAQDYAAILPDGEKFPPFIIVADIGHAIDIYADFRSSGDYAPFPSARENRILLEDFRKPEVQELFRKIWTDPLSLDPTRESEKVTRALALKLSELAKSLEQSGADADSASLFLQRCIFVMFAEDCGLIPHGSFTALLTKLKQNPERFAPAMTELWKSMRTGGESAALGTKVLQFHGYLFEDARALPLNKEQLAILHEAAKANWSGVDTAIFGALLERALSPQERHKLGAHYTPTAYVERLVIPTIMEPEREQWERAKAAALAKALAGDSQAAVAEITTYYKHLATISVLDPSCGSGNFLAVSLNLLKDLEGEVVQALRTLGLSEREIQKMGYSVGPHQMRGVEIVQRGADISELVLWISYLQRHYKIHGNINPPEPILRPSRSVECRDAVLAFDDTGKPIPAAAWPDATYIVGNPPFAGNKRMRKLLGGRYTEALRAAYPEVSSEAEYVMYWWHRAASLAREGKVQRFGLITTNSITQVQGRKVVEHHMSATPSLSIIWAVPDHPWIDDKDGAQVRIAMTVGAIIDAPGTLLKEIHRKPDEAHQNEQRYIVYFDRQTGRINANLTVGVDVSKAVPLRGNEGLSSPGVKLYGKGFLITAKEAEKLGFGKIQGLEKHIRPYLNGRDLAGNSRNLLVIDLFGLSALEVQKRYPAVYQYLLDNVKPERDRNAEPNVQKNWWLFGRPRSEMRPALEGLTRYIVTPETARRRYFVFFDSTVLPDNMLIVIASDDAYHLGVLSSKIHSIWALEAGARLGVGNDPRYSKSVCFDPFPFPNVTEEQKARIRAIAEAMDAHRKQRRQLHPKLTLTDMYAVMERIHNGVNLSPKEARLSEQGDLAALMRLHTDLDAAVADAYGWPAALTTDDILTRLLELNKQRAEEESKGTVRWLRPEFQREDPKDANKPLAPPGRWRQSAF